MSGWSRRTQPHNRLRAFALGAVCVAVLAIGFPTGALAAKRTVPGGAPVMRAAAPVLRAAARDAAPVVHVVTPVGREAARVAAPVVREATPVVRAAEPVVRAAAPVVHGVVRAAAPVLHAAAPVLHAAAPVLHAAAPVLHAVVPVAHHFPRPPTNGPSSTRPAPVRSAPAGAPTSRPALHRVATTGNVIGGHSSQPQLYNPTHPAFGHGPSIRKALSSQAPEYWTSVFAGNAAATRAGHSLPGRGVSWDPFPAPQPGQGGGATSAAGASGGGGAGPLVALLIFFVLATVIAARRLVVTPDWLPRVEFALLLERPG